MELLIKRIFKGNFYTIGHLYIDNEYFSDTLEDRVRDLPIESKVYGQTAIPSGLYKVVVNYSNKFKRKLPELLDVPYFEGIRIHRGNTAADSSGCILVGLNKVKGKVINSTPYEKKLVEILTKAQEKGEDITIKIE